MVWWQRLYPLFVRESFDVYIGGWKCGYGGQVPGRYVICRSICRVLFLVRGGNVLVCGWLWRFVRPVCDMAGV